MLLDDAVGDAQPQAGPTASIPGRRFGGEKRIVNSCHVLLRNSRAGVGHHHTHARSVCSRHPQGSPARHGVFGIEKQIQEYLLESSAIAADQRQVFGQLVLDLDARGPELVLQKR